MNEQKTPCILYDSNNSGGNWWLSDEDWFNLEKAGWVVKWFNKEEEARTGWHKLDSEGRWLGALATKAYRIGLRLRDAIAEWEKITNEYAETEGCPCCGQPHDFYETFVEDLY